KPQAIALEVRRKAAKGIICSSRGWDPRARREPESLGQTRLWVTCYPVLKLCKEFSMPRKAHIVKREILPDPMFQSTLVSKFVNCMMYGGKKSTAQHIFYRAMDVVQKKTQDEPLKLFKKAVENIKPVLEVKSRRVGGSTYQVPVEVNPARRTSLAIRWILTYS